MCKQRTTKRVHNHNDSKKKCTTECHKNVIPCQYKNLIITWWRQILRHETLFQLEPWSSSLEVWIVYMIQLNCSAIHYQSAMESVGLIRFILGIFPFRAWQGKNKKFITYTAKYKSLGQTDIFFSYLNVNNIKNNFATQQNTFCVGVHVRVWWVGVYVCVCMFRERVFLSGSLGGRGMSAKWTH